MGQQMQVGQEIVEEVEKTQVEQQVETSNKDLQTLVSEGLELVTNVRIANDAREVKRREENVVAHQERMAKLDQELVAGAQKLEEINARWKGILETNDPLDLYHDIHHQRVKCSELMSQKDQLIQELRKELHLADDRFMRDQRRQKQDLGLLCERIDQQVVVMGRAYKQELLLIEEKCRGDPGTPLERHLAQLMEKARYFDSPLTEEEITAMAISQYPVEVQHNLITKGTLSIEELRKILKRLYELGLWGFQAQLSLLDTEKVGVDLGQVTNLEIVGATEEMKAISIIRVETDYMEEVATRMEEATCSQADLIVSDNLGGHGGRQNPKDRDKEAFVQLLRTSMLLEERQPKENGRWVRHKEISLVFEAPVEARTDLDAISRERRQLIEAGKRKWEGLYKARDKLELSHIDKKMHTVQQFEQEMYKIHKENEEHYRAKKLQLETDLQGACCFGHSGLQAEEKWWRGGGSLSGGRSSSIGRQSRAFKFAQPEKIFKSLQVLDEN
uniref:Dynein regulatory complex protein 1/2 N-terminal domain-containing protein n=1 Tax=Timema shepardi TaxID=629360 RepID=A0A7R9G1U8_TIMSH|nr:unnamed protein product [Timema shepardi]